LHKESRHSVCHLLKEYPSPWGEEISVTVILNWIKSIHRTSSGPKALTVFMNEAFSATLEPFHLIRTHFFA